MLSETSQMQKDKHYMFLLVEYLKKKYRKSNSGYQGLQRVRRIGWVEKVEQ